MRIINYMQHLRSCWYILKHTAHVADIVLSLHNIRSEACRTRELSAEQKFTRDYWRKQNPPVCGKILSDFWHA